MRKNKVTVKVYVDRGYFGFYTGDMAYFLTTLDRGQLFYSGDKAYEYTGIKLLDADTRIMSMRFEKGIVVKRCNNDS